MVLIERSPWLCSEEVELFALVVLDALPLPIGQALVQ